MDVNETKYFLMKQKTRMPTSNGKNWTFTYKRKNKEIKSPLSGEMSRHVVMAMIYGYDDTMYMV